DRKQEHRAKREHQGQGECAQRAHAGTARNDIGRQPTRRETPSKPPSANPKSTSDEAPWKKPSAASCPNQWATTRTSVTRRLLARIVRGATLRSTAMRPVSEPRAA